MKKSSPGATKSHFTREKSFPAGQNHSARGKIAARTVETIPPREKPFRARWKPFCAEKNRSAKAVKEQVRRIRSAKFPYLKIVARAAKQPWYNPLLRGGAAPS